MFGEQWHEIVGRRKDALAIVQPDRQVTFAELDAIARAHPAAGQQLEAQGDAITLAKVLIAGLLSGVPVQVVEQDRGLRAPESAIPPGTTLIKQTVGASGIRRCQFFTLPQIQADVARLHDALELDDYEAIVAPISLAHSYGLTVGLLQVLFQGRTLHWLPQPFPASVAEALSRHSRVMLAGVPAIWKAWSMSGLPMTPVACALSAGSKLTLALEQRIREQHSLKLRNLYGTSECGAVALDMSGGLRDNDDLVGSLLPGVSAEIAAGGRLLISSDAVGLGYDVSHEGEVFAAGQHLTWDTGTISVSKLHLTGCEGKGINVAGRKLSPDEVAEKVRQAVPGVGIQITSGLSRDPERCHEVVATVHLPQEALTTDFKTQACTHLAPWEVPRRWVTS